MPKTLNLLTEDFIEKLRNLHPLSKKDKASGKKNTGPKSNRYKLAGVHLGQFLKTKTLTTEMQEDYIFMRWYNASVGKKGEQRS